MRRPLRSRWFDFLRGKSPPATALPIKAAASGRGAPRNRKLRVEWLESRAMLTCSDPSVYVFDGSASENEQAWLVIWASITGDCLIDRYDIN